MNNTENLQNILHVGTQGLNEWAAASRSKAAKTALGARRYIMRQVDAPPGGEEQGGDDEPGGVDLLDAIERGTAYCITEEVIVPSLAATAGGRRRDNGA